MTAMCIAAANYLVELTNEYNVGKSYREKIRMTCKRLQKLLYFGDVLYMRAHNGDSMFKDEFYAWPSGPVIPSVYDEFMRFQDGDMQPIGGEHTPIDDEMKAILDKIFSETIDIDTEILVESSHVAGGPWSQVYDPDDSGHFQIVSKKLMYDFYKKDRELFLAS